MSSEDDDTSDTADVVPPKKVKTEWSKTYSEKVVKMMTGMGYKQNQGLGKAGQGRLEPVEAAKQEGRRGLGLKLEKLSTAAREWREDLEAFSIPEKMDWIQNPTDDLDYLSMEHLTDWVRRAPKKMTIDDETNFCDPKILENMLCSKTAFDDLDCVDMRRARTRSNPFETIRESIFLNRAAVKMANIDSMCDFMFTNPVDEMGMSLVRKNELLYFADICAGPGGFTEYVLYKKGWEAKGFGFTLRETNNFKLENFYAASPDTFFPHYGAAGDGNIFNPENQESFAKYVLEETETGVHFVMADGGFSVEGKENIQEILSKQLYLCQCLVALNILREKGHFVCKLFDIFTPFSVGLVYLMYKCFEKISICKPNSSRPANSERYIVCKWKKPNTDTVRRFFSQINQEMWDDPNAETDVRELVVLDKIFEDEEFVKYITESNNNLGQSQIVGLIKIAAFCQKPDLVERRQPEFREKCLQLWGLPSRMRKKPDKKTPTELLTEFKCTMEDVTTKSKPLVSKKILDERVICDNDWYFVPLARSKNNECDTTTFFLCCGRGRGNVLQLEGGCWKKVEYAIEMSPKTLIYGEIVQEQIGPGNKGQLVSALHIIDAIALGGKLIAHYPLKKRLELCDKFARSLCKPLSDHCTGDQVQTLPMRVKNLIPLKSINDFFLNLKQYKMKNVAYERPGMQIRTKDRSVIRFYVLGGLLLIPELLENYISGFSKTQQMIYYCNIQSNVSYFPCNLQSPVFSTFLNAYKRRLVWKWTHMLQVAATLPENEREPDTFYRIDFPKCSQ